MILDTVAMSELIDGNRALAKALDVAPRHHVPVVALGEYRYGLLRSRKRARLETALDRLVAKSDILTIDAETARTYAEIRLELRTQGTPIPLNDLWIAALARQHGLPVATQDAHFVNVKGLKRVTW